MRLGSVARAARTSRKVVQLGHGSVAITLDLYGHPYPDEMDRWADRLGEIAERMWLERASPTITVMTVGPLASAQAADQGFCGYAARDSNSEPAD